MLEVVVSPSGADRVAAAGAFVRAFPPATEVLVVGASREAVDDFIREAAAGAGASFGLHRFSLTQLAARVAAGELASRRLAPGSALGTEAVATRATFEVLRRGGLRYFEPVARCPGFGRALASTVSDLRLAALDARRVAGLGPAGADLAELVVEFETQLTSAAVTDRATLLDTAARAVREGGAGTLPLVLLDVPVHSLGERALVGALLAMAPRALVTIPTGDDRTREAIAALGDGREPETPPGKTAPSGLDRLRKYLFSDERPPESEGGDEVVFFSAPGESRECVEIARRVLDEARRGVPFDQIAILLRAPEVYGGLLETALRRAGIPAYFARGTRRPDPSGRAFLALLACAAEGLSARRFGEYLSLGQVPSLDPDGAPPAAASTWQRPDDEGLGPAAEPLAEETEAVAEELADIAPDTDEQPVVAGTLRAPWHWERLLVEAAVIGGTDRWRRRLDGLAAEYRLKHEELRSEEPESARLPGIERDLANLGHLRRFTLPVIDLLADLPREATWGEWLDALERLVPMVLRAPHRVLAVLADLRPMSAVGPAPLDEVRDVLAERLATVQERPPARRYGRVFVGSPEQARGRSFRVVFAPGLSERVFPRKPREDPLLLDGLRRALDRTLPTREDRGQHERLLLRLAAGAARERLTLSYSRVEVAQGRPRVPSFYALEMTRAITGRLRDFQALERQAAREAGARLAWPAPDDSAHAIDAIEHDLAVLGALLRSGDRDAEAGHARERGRASYLLQLSPPLARSLRSQWWRWKKPGWAPFDGLVRATERTREALAGHRLAARPYSVSALQKFAACPYQFFLSAICRLAPREEAVPLQQLDPLMRGKIFHRVQAELLRELRDAGHLPLRPASFAVARDVLERVLMRVARDCEEQLAPAIDRVWQGDLETLKADLRGWLHRLAEAGTEWEPILFEFAFGFAPTPELDPGSHRDPVTLAAGRVDAPGGFMLHGVIDVVERRTDGDDLRVTDHKTGVNRTRAGMVIGGGETLQPVLYGLAVEAALQKRVAEARLFFCTPVGGFAERTVSMTDEVRQTGVEVLRTVDRAIEAGFLPPAPRERACTWCDFVAVCGPSAERRARHKDPVPLADLRSLRKLP